MSEALKALLAYQQCDEDGVMCKTSRQAVHEIADEIDRLRGLLREARADVQYHHDCAEMEDCLDEQGDCIDRLARIDAALAGAADRPK